MRIPAVVPFDGEPESDDSTRRRAGRRGLRGLLLLITCLVLCLRLLLILRLLRHLLLSGRFGRLILLRQLLKVDLLLVVVVSRAADQGEAGSANAGASRSGKQAAA